VPKLPRFLALYDIEAEDPQAAITALKLTPKQPISEHMDRSKAIMQVYRILNQGRASQRRPEFHHRGARGSGAPLG